MKPQLSTSVNIEIVVLKTTSKQTEDSPSTEKRPLSVKQINTKEALIKHLTCAANKRRAKKKQLIRGEPQQLQYVKPLI